MTIVFGARVALAVLLLQPAVRLVCASSCQPQPVAPVVSGCHESAGESGPAESGQTRMTSIPACDDLQSDAPGLMTASARYEMAALASVVEWTPALTLQSTHVVDRELVGISPPPPRIETLRI